MEKLPSDNTRDERRTLGRYELVDPRPIAREAPYTFLLPTPAEIEALRIGDLVKLTFKSIPPSDKWNAERMWVRISEITPAGMIGTLEDDPSDMPQLERGANVHFQPHHILSIEFEEIANRDIPVVVGSKEYWERCLVDDCVLYDGVQVGFLYREFPDMASDEDKYPDSGWRIRGDYRNLPDDVIGARKLSYVALGAVLNKDDSWIHLIDAPIGSAFNRDFETGEYIAEQSPRDPEKMN